MDERNPYESPMNSVRASPSSGVEERRKGWLVYPAWFAIFIFNMIVPLLFGWPLVSERGKLGMAAAAVVLFSHGCYLCSAARRFAGPLLVGAALVALTQFFPAIQLVAGVIGMIAGQVTGLADFGDDEGRPERINGEFGGFVVTLVTGGILIALSIGTGLLIRRITPDQWWRGSSAVSDIIWVETQPTSPGPGPRSA